ncbi:FkbM family methyltransferase [Massilia sp. MP_M2]|uniref:FkbM family methyltransferase n=1 Tax=Massilia sp. MP_M2 TaxID=3071713 RepID=UPI00319E6685
MKDRMRYFISYSQNNEDVLLWRALGHIKNGYYIDVGANDPVEHSVTKAFYDAGWNGISIEPLPSFHQAFEEQRPRDVNLAVAAGAIDGELTLYDVPAVRGWASPEASVAEMHRAEGHDVAEITVPVRTLAGICAEHVRGEIHFLKIDVEGFEGEVLRGMDFKRWRPWVLVIEATLPNSRETNHASWEHMVLGQRYRYAWFDGLNRYYVAEEHAELLAQLDIQPNVFDGYVSHHLDKAWANEHALDAALGQAGEHARELTAVVKQVEAREQALHGHLERVDAQARGLLEQLDGAYRRLDEANARVNDLGERADHATRRANEEAQRASEEAQRANDAEQRNAALTHDLVQVHAQAERLTNWAKGMEAHLVAIEHSTSWRVTRPLRRAGTMLHGLRRPHLLRRVVTRLTRIELLRRTIIPVLLRFPWLARRVSVQLATIKQTAPAPLPADVPAVPDELRGLPESVRTVLADLQRARNLPTGS